MRELADQRCLNHEMREAACRCPVCKVCFCRECVSEYDLRLLCSVCIVKLQSGVAAPAAADSRLWPKLVLAAVGILLAWLIFYIAGWSILNFRESVPVAMLVKMNA
jgi:hypothetical protein